MPLTIKHNQLKYKNPDGSTYTSLDTVSDSTTTEKVAAINTAGDTQVGNINDAGTTNLATINARAAEISGTLSNIGEMEGMIAGTFSDSTPYAKGTYIIHNDGTTNKLYQFTVDHAAGAWNSAQVKQVKLGNDVQDLSSAFEAQMAEISYNDGWENKNYHGQSESSRLSILMQRTDAEKFVRVIAPTGYSVGIAAHNQYVWTGTEWAQSNLLYAQSLYLTNIDMSAYSNIRFILKENNGNNISVSIGKSVIFNVRAMSIDKGMVLEDNLYPYIKSVNANLLNLDLVTIGYRIDGETGEIVTQSGYGVSDYIPVTSGQTIYATRIATTTTRMEIESAQTPRFAFYDEQKTFITGESVPASHTTVPTNAKYARFSCSTWINNDTMKPMISTKVTGLSTSQYEPFRTIADEYPSVREKAELQNMVVFDKEIIDSFANTFITDLNNAEDNRSYIVQRTASTSAINFPPDFPTSGVAILETYKAVYHANGYTNRLQKLTLLSSGETWFRSKASNSVSWGAWDKYIGNKIIVIGSGQTYTTLKDGFAAAVKYKNVTVYVLPGTYDLLTEFSSSISSTMSTVGIALGNGVHAIFADGAKVTANFDNSESTYDSDTWRRIYDRFEPFYSKSYNENADYTIENLDIECKNTRYCIHDEMVGTGTYTHKYFNCKMKYTNDHSDINYVQCIGGGLGEHGTIVIDGGSYKSVPNYGIASIGGLAENSQQCISYHNGNNANADSSITIKNVYLADRGYFRFGWYGPSTIKSQVHISGCGTGLPTLLKAEGTASVVNFEVTEFCNQKRINSHWSVAQDGRTATLLSD